MFDSHVHLADTGFDRDREAVLQRARQHGVCGCMCVISEPAEVETFRRELEGQPGVLVSAGVHPHNAAQYERYEPMLGLLEVSPAAVAWGEIGLDYHYLHSPAEEQRRVFRDQLLRAKKRELPVIVHSRDAGDDTCEILQECQISRGVIHCFSDGEDMLRRYCALGLYVAVGGVITFRRAEGLRRVAGLIPLDRLLVETDAPYLAPRPHRGHRNEPAWVRYVVETLAHLRGVSYAHMAQITHDNALRLFGVRGV